MTQHFTQANINRPQATPLAVLHGHYLEHPHLQIMGQGQGRELPFDVGTKYDCLSGKTIWSVHAGKRKVSIESGNEFIDVYL